MDAKKRKIIFAIVIVVVILAVMFFSQSKSAFVRQLNGPTEGTGSVLTIGDKLFVISKDNHVFIWQWNDLKI
jgi:uncharacterized membrane protein